MSFHFGPLSLVFDYLRNPSSANHTVTSGRIETPLQLKSVEMLGPDIPTPFAIKRKGEAKEVAELIAWLLSDSTKYISGTVELIDGCWIC